MYRKFNAKHILKNNSGSAMIMAIFLTIVVSMLGLLLTIYISNQFKSTNDLNRDIQMKYIAEAGVEEIVANTIKSIGVRNGNILYDDKTITGPYETIKLTNPIILNINNNTYVSTSDETTGKLTLEEKSKKLNLNIISKANEMVNSNFVDEYKIEANVEIIVSNIKSNTDFDIVYNIKTWNKKE